MKHKIVCLDGWVKLQNLDFEYDLEEYQTTRPEELVQRLQGATIIVTAAIKLPRVALEQAKELQLVATPGTGTDHVDHSAVQELGITMCHVPAQNTDSVSEHAFALYYGLRRHVIAMHEMVIAGDIWGPPSVLSLQLNGKPPRTNAEETLVVIGYGALGKNVERIGKALGMTVLVAERKGNTEIREGRVAFDEALKRGTVFIVVAPLQPDTHNMIGNDELKSMDRSALLVNAGRGGIVSESALAQALRDGEIAGAATDVFEHEPATKENCPLLDRTIPNILLSPHVAWYSERTIRGAVEMLKRNIELFVAGRPQNMVIPGRRGLPSRE